MGKLFVIFIILPGFVSAQMENIQQKDVVSENVIDEHKIISKPLITDNDVDVGNEVKLDESEIKHEPEFIKAIEFVLTNDEKNLVVTNEAFFTLQWMAVSSLKAAQSEITKHPMKDSMQIYRRNYKNKYLYY